MKEINSKSKWLCPECGMTGVAGYPPLCHICDFKVRMVQISDLVYNHRIKRST